VEAKEAVGEDSTLEIGAKLAFDETRHGVVALAGAGEEGLEVLTNDLVK
jgi:hypothetical protein